MHSCLREFLDSVEVRIADSLVVDLPSKVSICHYDSIVLFASDSSKIHLWQDGSTDSVFTAKSAGKYWVQIDSSGCLGSDTTLLSIHPHLKDLDTTKFFACANDTVSIDVRANDIATYLWEDLSSSPIIKIWQSDTLWLERRDTFGCLYIDTIEVIKNYLSLSKVCFWRPILFLSKLISITPMHAIVISSLIISYHHVAACRLIFTSAFNNILPSYYSKCDGSLA